MFTDECTVFVEAGRGGGGSASLHSEPYKPRGGPDGGNGGRGGSIVFEVARGIHDLSWMADHPHQRARPGGSGRSARRDGASAKDLVIQVPDGTMVFDEDGPLADLVGEGARVVVARGGRLFRTEWISRTLSRMSNSTLLGTDPFWRRQGKTGC